MHGTAGRAAHLARTLMMVALLPRGLIGGLGEDPDAISYPESKHASTYQISPNPPNRSMTSRKLTF